MYDRYIAIHKIHTKISHRRSFSWLLEFDMNVLPVQNKEEEDQYRRVALNKRYVALQGR